MLGLSVLLSYFGVDVTAVATMLALGGLAISLAAKDTIADAIAELIILVDRPFRIGDPVEIQKVGTWRDVVDIGLRTTRIRTRPSPTLDVDIDDRTLPEVWQAWHEQGETGLTE